MNVGERIKEIAQQRGVTPQLLATRLDKSLTAVYDIFRKKHVNTELLYQLAEILECEMSDFLIAGDLSPKKSSTGGQEISERVLDMLEGQIEDLRRNNEFLRGLLSDRIGKMDEKLAAMLGKADAATVVEMYPERKPLKVVRTA